MRVVGRTDFKEQVAIRAHRIFSHMNPARHLRHENNQNKQIQHTPPLSKIRLSPRSPSFAIAIVRLRANRECNNDVALRLLKLKIILRLDQQGPGTEKVIALLEC
ncbi:MAG: hypothetical protein R3D43_07375 [Tepidamorphaceae bacterium]